MPLITQNDATAVFDEFIAAARHINYLEDVECCFTGSNDEGFTDFSSGFKNLKEIQRTSIALALDCKPDDLDEVVEDMFDDFLYEQFGSWGDSEGMNGVATLSIKSGTIVVNPGDSDTCYSSRSKGCYDSTKDVGPLSLKRAAWLAYCCDNPDAAASSPEKVKEAKIEFKIYDGQIRLAANLAKNAEAAKVNPREPWFGDRLKLETELIKRIREVLPQSGTLRVGGGYYTCSTNTLHWSGDVVIDG